MTAKVEADVGVVGPFCCVACRTSWSERTDHGTVKDATP